MRSFALLLVAFVGQQTQACRSCRSAPEPAGTPAGSANAATNASATPKIPTALPARRPPPPGVARQHRARILAAMRDARAAIAENRARDAITTLAKATPLDPTGGAIAVEMSRAAAAAGDDRRAREWAQRAVDRGSGNASVAAAAEQALRAAAGKPRPGLDATSLGPFPSADAACAELSRQVELGKSPALGLAQHNVTAVDCHSGPPHRVSEAGLEAARELRLTIDQGGRTEASWVALQAARGWMVYGPLVRVHTPAAHAVLNAYTLRLNHFDALPGGHQEISVGIDERLTRLDVALNETLSVDRNRLVVLSLDRDPIAASPAATTFELSVVRAIDAQDKEPPPTPYRPSDLREAPRSQRFRVRWSDNALVLSPQAGAETATNERRVVLFP
jgi:hypothetical protein